MTQETEVDLHFIQTALDTLLDFYNVIVGCDAQSDVLNTLTAEDNQADYIKLYVAYHWIGAQEDNILKAIASLTPAIATPDTPTAGVTGSGARYTSGWNPDTKIFGVYDWNDGKWVAGEAYHVESQSKNASARLNAAQAQVCTVHGSAYQQRFDSTWGCQLCDWQQNAALPASGTDTVAGSGNGGARYVPKRHETSKFRYCVWDTETETALQIASERFIWTTLPRVKRECARLNASKRYVVQTETADVMFPLSKIVDTETNTELEGVYIDIETANGECSRLNGESS